MDQFYNYNKQPTLLIALGGFGSKIADNIYGHVKDGFNVSAFSIDTDIYDSKRLINIPQQHIISIAQHHQISDCLNYLPKAKEWFPNNSILFHKTISEGAGQVRAISRLAYEISLCEHRFDVLLDEVKRLAEECVEGNCHMRISIIATLAGGTASGIFLQVALLIREYLNQYFPAVKVKIQGDFILPSTFLSLTEDLSKIERRYLESNTYAALKELHAFNAHYFSNASPIELQYGYSQTDGEKPYVNALPYDYCFLYDRVSFGRGIGNQYIENAIIERLFSNSANSLNEAFVNALRLDSKKQAGNLYGTICTEKLSLESTIVDSEIFRSIINRTSSNASKKIFLVRSPKKIDIDKAFFPQNTIFIEEFDDSVSETTIVEFDFEIELCKIEKLKFQSGQYYIPYKKLIDRLPMAITPHLNTKWHTELSDIGEDIDVDVNYDSAAQNLRNIPKDKFVFISYSSREIETANQLTHILETNGVHCWMAPQSIPAGSDYGSEIPQAIEKCKAFLLLLSDASQNSNWVPKEVGLAIGKGKIVIPFQIDNAAISEAFNFYLTNSQRISAYNRMTEAYQELLNRLKDILS